MKALLNTSVHDASGSRPVSLFRVVVTQQKRLGILLMALMVAGGMVFSASSAAMAQTDVLEHVQSLFSGLGIRSATDVAVSPDGKFVYALGEQDNAVVLFEREDPSGDLNYIATYVNGENNVEGLASPRSLAISDDGANLYVVGVELDFLTGQRNGTVVVFTRDAGTGALTYVETMKNDMGDVKDMTGPDALDISPDGANLYVAGDIALTIFTRDASESGKLTFVESVGDNSNTTPFQLTDVIVADDDTVYLSSYIFDAVIVLSRNAADQGRVETKQVVFEGNGGVEGIKGTQKLAATTDGNSLYVTGEFSGTVALFDRASDGMLTFAEAYYNGVGGIDGIGGARSVVASEDGESVYIAGVKQDALAAFSRAADGKLSFNQCFTSSDGNSCQKDVGGLIDPSAIALAPSDADLYVTGRESNAISHYSRDTSSGQLAFVSVLHNRDGGIPGMGGAIDVAVSQDGKNTYVVSERDDAVVVFSRDSAGNGSLTYVEHLSNSDAGFRYMRHPKSVAVSPDGGSVYVAVRNPDKANFGSLHVFSRDSSTGELTLVEVKINAESGTAGLAGAYDIAISPDSKNVYVTGIQLGTIAVFSRDTTTGKLTEVQFQMDGVSGVTGLAGAAGIVVSPDGKSVYVAGSNADSIVVFNRSGSQGELIWVGALKNGEMGINGLDGPISVDVTADNKNVYVASATSGRVVAFKRDTENGHLQFLASYSGKAPIGASDVDVTLATPYYGVSVSPDNQYIFAIRWTIDETIFDPIGSLVAFARDEASGLLSTVQVMSNGEDGVKGLRTPTAIATSADAKNIYVTSGRDSAVVTFKVIGSAPYVDLSWLPQLSKAE